MFSDLHYSLRLLKKTPGFTGFSLLVIVLGLTHHMVSFSIVGVLSDKPMPFPNGDRYVVFKQLHPALGLDAFAAFYDEYEYNIIRSTTQSYSVLGAISEQPMVVSDGEYAETVSGVWIEPQLLQATAVKPLIGRVFTQEDLLDSNADLALIGESLWRNYFAADQSIIGKPSRINGRLYTVIGVMPEEFRYPRSHNLWLPLEISNTATPENAKPLAIVGILKQGISLMEATQELDTIRRKIKQDYPSDEVYSKPLVDAYASQLFPSKLGMDLGSFLLTSIILGLAAINLGSLLFIRVESRQHEMAIRASVGATRVKLVQQLLLETLLLSSIGFALSLFVSEICLRIIDNFVTENSSSSPFWYRYNLDFESVRIGLIATFSIWLFASSSAVLRIIRNQNANMLSANKGTVQKGVSAHITRFVVGIEVVFSCFLLVSCLLIISWSFDLMRHDIGTEVDNYYGVSIPFAGSTYDNPEARIRFVDKLEEELESIPEVRSAAFTTELPGEGTPWHGAFDVEGFEISGNLDQLTVWVSDNYFSSMGVELLAGRFFDTSDQPNSNSVAIVPVDFANRFWPDDSALGKLVTLKYDDKSVQVTIIGITTRIEQSGVAAEIVSPFYRPYRQDMPNIIKIAILAENVSTKSLEQEIKQAVTRVDRDVAINNLKPLSEHIEASWNNFGSIANLFSLVALIALVFACIGIYGIVARSITLKTHVIGVCRALGSSNQKIISQHVRQGLRYLIIGGIIGCGPAIFLVAPLLAKINPSLMDSVVFSVSIVIALMAVLIGVASYLPIRRVIAMEPGDALRYE